jgi:aerobic carbon-monoxide dehydrogenase large subunit
MIGSARRVDDGRLLRGQGRFVGDLHLPGQLEVAFLRSPHAHARLVKVDVTRARQAPGVALVLTGRDAAALTAPLRPKLHIPNFKVCEMPCLATDRVRYSGQAVAAVVAQDRYLAEDGRELIDVEYDPLAAVVDARRAVEPAAPILHAHWDDNVHVEATFEAGDVAASC